MSEEWEDQSLARLADRLERDRPVPAPVFRGELRRRLTKGSVAPGRSSAPSLRAWVASYVGAGALCLAVAVVGLLGAGPFAA
jgi:hypothetical protein